MSKSNLRFSIVLPCYNEGQCLPLLLNRYREVWRHVPAELVLVDNGSTDETAKVLERELSKQENQFVRSIRIPVNQGYGFGVMQGVRQAQGDVIGISHADMQCDPADLFLAYDVLCANGERGVLVKGRRHRRGLGSEIVTGAMATLASIVLCRSLTDINAQPKVFSRELIDQLGETPNGFELDLCIFYAARKLNWKVVTIPVTFAPRPFGISKWAFSLASRRIHIWTTVKYIFKLRLSAF